MYGEKIGNNKVLPKVLKNISCPTNIFPTDSEYLYINREKNHDETIKIFQETRLNQRLKIKNMV